MTDSLLSRFADLVIYLIPGMLVLLTATYRFAPEQLKHPQEKLGFGELVIGLAVAYLIGVITFRLSDEIINVLAIVYGESVLEGIARRFPELAKVDISLRQVLSLKPDGPVTCYRYAAAVIVERAPRSAEAAERLLALAHLFRNLLVCTPLTALFLLQPLRARFGWKGLVSVGLASALLEFIFLKTFLAFWAAAVWKYLRAYVVWAALG